MALSKIEGLGLTLGEPQAVLERTLYSVPSAPQASFGEQARDSVLAFNHVDPVNPV
jgi:hypothetical protein